LAPTLLREGDVSAMLSPDHGGAHFPQQSAAVRSCNRSGELMKISKLREALCAFSAAVSNVR